MYHFAFYVPEEYLERVKEAVFQAGAGRIGNYDFCAFQTKGQGQFRPLEGSRPFIGASNQIEFVNEIKVEMVCEKSVMPEVVKALKSSHPYETPAYYLVEIIMPEY